MHSAKSDSTSVRLAAVCSFALAAALLAGFVTCAVPGSNVTAQSTPAEAREGSFELEEPLFLVDPHLKNAQGAPVLGAMSVESIPQPIQKYCLDKTSQECSTIDFCIRTTTKSVAMCQNLPANLRDLPPYPAGMRPSRVHSITFFKGAPNIQGFDALRRYYDGAPQGTFDRFSTHARFDARVRVTPKGSDDDFELLEVLSVPAR
jgi:hypothetical protein